MTAAHIAEIVVMLLALLRVVVGISVLRTWKSRRDLWTGWWVILMWGAIVGALILMICDVVYWPIVPLAIAVVGGVALSIITRREKRASRLEPQVNT